MKDKFQFYLLHSITNQGVLKKRNGVCILYYNGSSLPNFWDVFWTKKDRCIELYYESNEYNITYCHGKIYKILGEIPNEILEAQQLFYDIGESSDYESLIAYLETKKKK